MTNQDSFKPSRRDVLAGGTGIAAAGMLASTPMAAISKGARPSPATRRESMLAMRDGTGIFVKDWGSGPPVVFCHGWPLSADAWDGQMMAFVERGFRVIAHDRRSHGRSDQTRAGNDMAHYADDLAEILFKLDVRGATLVGHSTGGGEVARYIGRHGTARVSKSVLVSAVPPLMLKTTANPAGTPIEVFDDIRRKLVQNRAQYYLDLTLPFFGFNRPGANVLESARSEFWRQGMMGGIKGQYDCVHEFSEVDYSSDLRRMSIPTLLIHGSDDQIVPIAAASQRSVTILPRATLKVYEGAPHGIPVVQQERLNSDLLQFIRS